MFREYSKCLAHYNTQHSRRAGFQCKKFLKVLGTKANLANHRETYHKYTNFVCNLCQFATSKKAEMEKHMKSHDRWVQHPELRCRYCLQVLHNKDGLHQHLKTCRHNPERPQQQYMCRNPGCGSVFSLLKKRNYHKSHRCHLLKKNQGRGRGQPQQTAVSHCIPHFSCSSPQQRVPVPDMGILVLQREHQSPTEGNCYIMIDVCCIT